jgi:hypothetical protein
VPVNALTKDRGGLVQVHRTGPSQHIAQNAFMEGHVRGQLPGCIKRLAHEAGNAIQRCLHDMVKRFLSRGSNVRTILPTLSTMCQGESWAPSMSGRTISYQVRLEFSGPNRN